MSWHSDIPVDGSFLSRMRLVANSQEEPFPIFETNEVCLAK
jgi:hypothetical protein